MKRSLLVLTLMLSALLLALVFTSCSLFEPQECEHVFGPWEVIREANCTEEGKRVRSCSECGETERETTEPHGHDSVKDEAVDPTCTKAGLTEGLHCSVCGEVLLAQTEIAPIGHKEKIIPGKAATCTEKGLSDGKTCLVCNEVLQ